MSAKMRTGALSILVAVLSALWWIGSHTSPRAEQRTFREHLLRVDTTALRDFTIVPAHSLDTLHFHRSASGWNVIAKGRSTPADDRPMRSLLPYLADMRALRVIGNGQAVRDAHGLSDSTADRLIAPDIEHGTVTLLVGREMSDGETATPVAVMGDAATYATPGYPGEFTGMSFVDWIPKPMVNGDPANWTRVTFIFPGSKSYSLERQGPHWTLNGLATDSIKVAHYLRNLSRYSGKALTDPADTLHAQLVYCLRVEDKSRDSTVVLGIFAVDDRLIARSTLAPPWLVMPFDPQEELPRIFRSPEAFLPN